MQSNVSMQYSSIITPVNMSNDDRLNRALVTKVCYKVIGLLDVKHNIMGSRTKG